MKLKLVCFLVLFISCSIYSQETKENNKSINEIGFELTGLVDSQYMLTYERSLNDQYSFLVGVGFKSEEGFVNLSGLDTPHIKTGDLNYSGFKIIAEGRYYLKEQITRQLIGFYIGAYAKHSNFSSDIFGAYIDDDDNVFTVDFDTDFHTTSIGFMVGYKLPLSKKFNFDFLIAGPGAAFYNFSLTNNNPLSDSFYEDLNEALENYNLFDFIDGDFDFKVNNLSSGFTGISFRYAIKLNYSL